MRDLFLSAPDVHSQLTGRELVARKVKQVVFQGGWYAPLHVRHPDRNHTHGRQMTFNWDCGRGAGYDITDCQNAAAIVVNTMPETVQMIFSDIGDGVWHGGDLVGAHTSRHGAVTYRDQEACAPESSPCRRAYERYLVRWEADNRMSWDPIVIGVAVRGAKHFFGRLTDHGWRNNVSEVHGKNTWAPTALNDTLQSQFVLKGPFPWEGNRWYAGLEIDRLLCRDPVCVAANEGSAKWTTAGCAPLD